MLNIILVLICSFALGSIPTGHLIAKMYGINLREHGSGNTGATNVGRVLGKKAGILTLLIDVAKGFIAALLGIWFSPCSEFVDLEICKEMDVSSLPAVAGTVALLGHCFSPFLKFKGGKGVATGGGVFLVVAPAAATMSIGVFSIVFRLTKIVSISSILAAATIPALLIGTRMQMNEQLFGITEVAAIICAAVIILRHHTNIARLIKGTEPKYKSASKDK
mgnify:CR=1 FL=1